MPQVPSKQGTQKKRSLTSKVMGVLTSRFTWAAAVGGAGYLLSLSGGFPPDIAGAIGGGAGVFTLLATSGKGKDSARHFAMNTAAMLGGAAIYAAIVAGSTFLALGGAAATGIVGTVLATVSASTFALLHVVGIALASYGGLIAKRAFINAREDKTRTYWKSLKKELAGSVAGVTGLFSGAVLGPMFSGSHLFNADKIMNISGWNSVADLWNKPEGWGYAYGEAVKQVSDIWGEGLIKLTEAYGKTYGSGGNTADFLTALGQAPEAQAVGIGSLISIGLLIGLYYFVRWATWHNKDYDENGRKLKNDKWFMTNQPVAEHA